MNLSTMDFVELPKRQCLGGKDKSGKFYRVGKVG